MKKNVVYFCLLFIPICALFSCKKKADTLTPVVNTNYDGSIFRKNFFAQNGVPVQIFSINATSFQTIIGAKGTKVLFNPNSFVTNSGATVTGTIQIELKEIYTKKDMILSGVFPTSNGKPLISGGEFYIKASQNGQELKLANQSSVTIELPVSNTNSTGNMNEFYTRNAVDTTNWGNAAGAITKVFDSLTATSYYSFALDSLNWGNCDQFFSLANSNHFGVKIADTSFNGRNTMVVVSYNGLNNATMLRSYSIANQNFEADHSPYLPVGMNVTFIAISQKGNQWYSAIHSTSIGNNHVENLTLVQTSLSQIQTALGNLQ